MNIKTIADIEGIKYKGWWQKWHATTDMNMKKFPPISHINHYLLRRYYMHEYLIVIK